MDEKAKRKTSTSSEVKNRYNAKTYDTIRAPVKIETAQKFKELAKKNGDTISSIINAAIISYIEDKSS